MLTQTDAGLTHTVRPERERALGFMSQITARPAVMSSRARSHAKGSLHRCRVHWWKPGSKIMNGRACVYHSTVVCGWCIAAMLDSQKEAFSMERARLLQAVSISMDKKTKKNWKCVGY